MIFQSPSVLAFHSGQLFFSSAFESHNVTAVARMEFLVMTVVCFLKCARDGYAWNVAELDPRLKRNTSVFHQIS